MGIEDLNTTERIIYNFLSKHYYIIKNYPLILIGEITKKSPLVKCLRDRGYKISHVYTKRDKFTLNTEIPENSFIVSVRACDNESDEDVIDTILQKVKKNFAILPCACYDKGSSYNKKIADYIRKYDHITDVESESYWIYFYNI